VKNEMKKERGGMYFSFFTLDAALWDLFTFTASECFHLLKIRLVLPSETSIRSGEIWKTFVIPVVALLMCKNKI
jgi:hypothetical protein